jgi:uncharacterized protein (UPF0248 family)
MSFSRRTWVHTAAILTKHNIGFGLGITQQIVIFGRMSPFHRSSFQRFSFLSLHDENDRFPMPNLYQEWSLDQDRQLWEHRQESLPTLASMLGRGLRGVEARLAKLRDVNSPAYERLFAKQDKAPHSSKYTLTNDSDGDDVSSSSTKAKLIPVSEVLRRIRWDATIQESDFTVLHHDRVNNTLVEAPLDAPNHSIQGKATQFIDALPEHRIAAVKYKERIVWDKQQRLDLVFGEPGIEQIMSTYKEWKRQKDEEEAWNRQREAEVVYSMQRALGLVRYQRLDELSVRLQTVCQDETVSQKKEAETFVESARRLFREARQDALDSLDPLTVSQTDQSALDALSELVALFSDKHLSSMVLSEISLQLDMLDGKKIAVVPKSLPDIREEDLTETFVRGSGAGGQKINKTSNKVVLVHGPTQLRVECQDTRSLQQNRKIARKRLQLKLDEFLNGNQSRSGQKASTAVTKKQKAKAKSRARARKIQHEQEESDNEDDDDEIQMDDK